MECPLAIPNQISTISMHIQSLVNGLVKLHWYLLKLSSRNENTDGQPKWNHTILLLLCGGVSKSNRHKRIEDQPRNFTVKLDLNWFISPGRALWTIFLSIINLLTFQLPRQPKRLNGKKLANLVDIQLRITAHKFHSNKFIDFSKVDKRFHILKITYRATKQKRQMRTRTFNNAYGLLMPNLVKMASVVTTKNVI